MRYEVIREIFNSCANNQMRDVFFSEIDTDDPDKIVDDACRADGGTYTCTANPDGTRIYDISSNGLNQRMTFTPED